MAKSIDNIVTAGLSGQVGKQLVFRQRNGKTIVAKHAYRRNSKISAKQQAHQDKFALGALYAKGALLDPSLKQSYTSEAAKRIGVSPYNLALADYLKAPVISKIDLSGYKGAASDEKIFVEVTDTFKVVSVRVKILKANNAEVEEGAATFTDGRWVYTTTTLNASPTGGKVIVTATDRPGNVTTKEFAN